VTFRAIIRPKEGILDPQGTAVGESLRKLGHPVDDVRVGRVVHLDVAVEDEAAGRRRVEQMCEELLANPLIETYEVERIS
jgi:phosphoribosylformylglycinamidine synthase subunit PurS